RHAPQASWLRQALATGTPRTSHEARSTSSVVQLCSRPSLLKFGFQAECVHAPPVRVVPVHLPAELHMQVPEIPLKQEYAWVVLVQSKPVMLHKVSRIAPYPQNTVHVPEPAGIKFRHFRIKPLEQPVLPAHRTVGV